MIMFISKSHASHICIAERSRRGATVPDLFDHAKDLFVGAKLVSVLRSHLAASLSPSETGRGCHDRHFRVIAQPAEAGRVALAA